MATTKRLSLDLRCPESEHPSLSGIDLSQLSEEELIDAIASAHEEELALESNDKGDAESPLKTRLKQKKISTLPP